MLPSLWFSSIGWWTEGRRDGSCYDITRPAKVCVCVLPSMSHLIYLGERVRGPTWVHHASYAMGVLCHFGTSSPRRANQSSDLFLRWYWADRQRDVLKIAPSILSWCLERNLERNTKSLQSNMTPYSVDSNYAKWSDVQNYYRMGACRRNKVPRLTREKVAGRGKVARVKIFTPIQFKAPRLIAARGVMNSSMCTRLVRQPDRYAG